MVPSFLEHDLASKVIEAGGSNAFLEAHIRDTNALRSARALAALCEQQRAAKARSAPAIKADASLQTAAEHSLSQARDRLEDIRGRAKAVLSEHEQRKSSLQELQAAFEGLIAARREHVAVSKCREIADAYFRALHPLALHQRDGTLTHIHSVASNIETLIRKVDSVRRKGSKCLFADDVSTNQRIIASIENRAVDAVIKARAAFVNVLDNEFRQFGWPMNVPTPENDDSVIESINFYVKQLNQLQRVASEGDYVPERTKWQRALSDSWAIAAILRAPLARFKYHFLESFRVESDKTGRSDTSIPGTSRFDRPEWAAEFALDRIREATPFLSTVLIDGPCTADVKFAEGFCRIFAEKVAYDCELALRSSTNDTDADVLIAHASETAKQFDTKLRSGVIRLEDKTGSNSSAPLFLSSLHILSLNESFLTTWASSELRLSDAEICKLLDRALGTDMEDGVSDLPVASAPISSRKDLEYICLEVVNHVGNASQKCRFLDSEERISTFLKLTELPLLQAIRSRLKEEVEKVDYEDLAIDRIERSGRASFCAQILADALEDRSLDPFYVRQEERLGRGFYDEDITRLRGLYSSNCSLLSDAISGFFIDGVRTGYADRTRFGEVIAPDAAVVLTHDLSDPLVGPLTALERSLSALTRGIPCRKSASSIWRPIAAKLDAFFFYDVVLQCFVGGSRNAMPAASEANNHLNPSNAARMARQVAFDASTFVLTFGVVSGNPSQFLPASAECGTILQIASNKVLLPSVDSQQEHEEVLEALRLVSESNEDHVLDAARDVLQSRIKVFHLGPREALELVAIGGLNFAIRLM